MFYANFILAKKGPLAKIWLAAHWDKKISKAHVFETDLEASVESILSPKVKIALRTSGHLLLGVVKIYSRKTKYLLADCSEALLKIKMAFRPGSVDLPESNRELAFGVVTLPELYTFGNPFELLPSNFEPLLDLNQCRAEDITLKEVLPHGSMVLEQNMMDTPFGIMDEQEILRSPSLAMNSTRIDSSIGMERPELSMTDDQPMQKVPQTDILQLMDNQLLQLDDDFGEGEGVVVLEPLKDLGINDIPDKEPFPPSSEEVMQVDNVPVADKTTLIEDVEDAYPLEPVENRADQHRRMRKKRKLVVDEETRLSGDCIRNQLEDASDTVRVISFAPPTKSRCRLREVTNLTSLFSTPVWHDVHPQMLELYHRNLTKTISGESAEYPDAQSDLSLSEDPLPSPGMQLASGEMQALAPLPPAHEPAALDEFEAGPADTMPLPSTPSEPPLSISTADPAVDLQTPTLPSRDLDDNAVFSKYDNDDDTEKRWTKRTKQMISVLTKEFSHRASVSFSKLTRGNTRADAAHKFYTLLILNKENYVVTQQTGSYGEIAILKGSRVPAC